MPTCPRGHTSAATDYCDVCGDLMTGAAPARFSLQENGSASVKESAGPTETCPYCGMPRNGRFCEDDGYDFEAGALPRAVAPEGGHAETAFLDQQAMPPAPPPPPPPSPPVQPLPEAPQAPEAEAQEAVHAPASGPSVPARRISGWSVTITADRDYYEAVMAMQGPDAGGLAFPPYCPERRLPLIGDRIRIGRRSMTRALFPEVDLGVAPEDPGVSHEHALLLAQPDGSWVLVDPGSTNGTTLNGGTTPLEAGIPVPVGDGDRIHVGAWTTITLAREGTR